MRIYKKQPLSVRTNTFGEDVPLEENAFSLGFDCADGILKTGTGLYELEEIAPPAGEAPAALFRLRGASGEYTYALYCTSGKLYYRAASGGAFADSGVKLEDISSAVHVCGDGEALLLSDGKTVVCVSENGAEVSESIPAFVCGAYYFERLWLAVPDGKCGVRYSAPAAFEDFTEEEGKGGYIAFPDGMGKITALVNFENYLYVFRENGLQRLEAYGAERDFKLRDVLLCKNIFGGSVAAVGGNLVWLAADGLYSYSGSGQAGRLCPDFSEAYAGAENENARSAAVGGEYALQAYTHGGKGPKLAIIRADGKGGYFAAEGVSGLADCAGAALCVQNGKLCEVRGESGEIRKQDGIFRIWSSRPIPRGARAVLRAVRIRARGEFVLTVQSDEGTRRICVSGSGKTERYFVSLAGEEFSFRLETDKACGKVYALGAEYEQRRET